MKLFYNYNDRYIMADFGYSSKQVIKQTQKQAQMLSYKQITALNFLKMGLSELKDVILKEVSENPALQVVSKKNKDNYENDHFYSYGSLADTEKFQQILESREDRSETLQGHLMHQLNSMNMPRDEYELSERLIYNLDNNGCYGSSISPENLLDRTRPLQTLKMLDKCIDRIQRMDPIGTCCKTLEESLYIQAKISGKASPLTLFILNGNLSLISPPEPKKILKKLNDYRDVWHRKQFASEILLDSIKLTEEVIKESLAFILKLNPRPAQGYTRDIMAEYDKPDIVLSVEKVNGFVRDDDFSKGIVTGDSKSYFQVKYASGILPDISIARDFSSDKENLIRARNFIDILAYRESTIVIQGCAIVSAQKDFFLNGMEYLKPLTRKQIAGRLGISESTVSRLSAKKDSKYVQTEYGTLPFSYFFTSGVTSTDGKEKISSEVIKIRMQEIIGRSKYNISDLQLTEMLNRKGIRIARRTVAKYRKQLGIENSYNRK